MAVLWPFIAALIVCGVVLWVVELDLRDRDRAATKKLHDDAREAALTAVQKAATRRKQ